MPLFLLVKGPYWVVTMRGILSNKNSQDILIQWSVNLTIIIHKILDISLYYINYQQKRSLGGFVPDIIPINAWMYNQKARYSLIMWFFFHIIWQIIAFRIVTQFVWLKIALFATTKEGLLNLEFFW